MGRCHQRTPARSDPDCRVLISGFAHSGGPFPYSKDGTIFKNKEGKLPEGNYREYTVDTPGATNRGARGIVQDAEAGRTYYTDDHYQTFIEIDPVKR